MQKFFQDQRSQSTPVGIVAVVSKNTIWKKNNANTATSSTPCRQKPFVPINWYFQAPALAASASPLMPKPSLRTAVPGPSVETQPSATGALYQLPQPRPKP